MNKAILLSIKPKYIVDLLNGKKTIEIRKTMPNCDLPIDVYIYCTKEKTRFLYQNKIIRSTYEDSGKVVAKFTLRRVEEIEKYTYPNYFGEDICDEDDFYYLESQPLSERKYDGLKNTTCLSEEELYEYLSDKKGYAWHIEDLVVFDEPKELWQFEKEGSYNKITDCPKKNRGYCNYGYSLKTGKYIGCEKARLIKAPRSYYYVEVD